jgi:hypothetical protein
MPDVAGCAESLNKIKGSLKSFSATFATAWAGAALKFFVT